MFAKTTRYFGLVAVACLSLGSLTACGKTTNTTDTANKAPASVEDLQKGFTGVVPENLKKDLAKKISDANTKELKSVKQQGKAEIKFGNEKQAFSYEMAGTLHPLAVEVKINMGGSNDAPNMTMRMFSDDPQSGKVETYSSFDGQTWNKQSDGIPGMPTNNTLFSTAEILENAKFEIVNNEIKATYDVKKLQDEIFKNNASLKQMLQGNEGNITELTSTYDLKTFFCKTAHVQADTKMMEKTMNMTLDLTSSDFNNVKPVEKPASN